MSKMVDNFKSPFARLRPVPVTAVDFHTGFWQKRRSNNWQNGIPRLYELLESHGVLNNFRRLYGAYDGPRKGYLFTDSDLYKWMEAAAITLQTEEISEIRDNLEQAIETILPAQCPDGYLNTWYVDERKNLRWTDLDNGHELYCAGHFFQAAIEYYRISKDTKLLEPAIHFADTIDRTFREERRSGSPGHPEIEMALIELYRITGNQRYLDLAGFFLDQRGVTSRSSISGHAVRACYFMSGAVDYYLETGDSAYLNAIESQWQDMVSRKIYITGGVGSRHNGEAFGNPFELPNERAYSETCASIGTIFWNWRILQANGAAQYADWLERTLYNGFLAGVSLSGDQYFYMNPLAHAGAAEDDPWYPWARKGPYQRQPWYDCTCCPPNVQRLIAALPRYFYSTSSEGLWIHLFDRNRLNWHLGDGSEVTIEQETDYPWSGSIKIKVSSNSTDPFTLFTRIPGWAGSASATLNGSTLNHVQPGEYLKLRKVWKEEILEISLDMPVEEIISDYRVSSTRGKAAIQRGPLIYCLEGIDHEDQDVRYLHVRQNSRFTIQDEPDLLGGVNTISSDGSKRIDNPHQPLYLLSTKLKEKAFEPVNLKFIPYYSWANRGPSSMAVWLPIQYVKDAA